MVNLNITKINSKYSSGLYLLSTPIGNIEDMTFRAVEIIKECDYIYCENPVISIKLLKHYQIEKKLFKYFDHSNSDKRNEIIGHIKSGSRVGYLSDSGTPTISDPGFKLVKECRQQDLNVFSIPGPCSAIAALSCSGLATDKFHFYGFLPRTSSKRNEEFNKLKHISGSLIFFESPNRIIDFLNDAKSHFSKSEFVIVKEITKKFETVQSFNFASFNEEQINFPIKGEFIIIIENIPENEFDQQKLLDFIEISKKELSNKTIINLAKKLFNLPKKDIYKIVLQQE
jgi:16S rRNA (cytidine1402-2'-O)-methyltransferase